MLSVYIGWMCFLYIFENENTILDLVLFTEECFKITLVLGLTALKDILNFTSSLA